MFDQLLDCLRAGAPGSCYYFDSKNQGENSGGGCEALNGYNMVIHFSHSIEYNKTRILQGFPSNFLAWKASACRLGIEGGRLMESILCELSWERFFPGFFYSPFFLLPLHCWMLASIWVLQEARFIPCQILRKRNSKIGICIYSTLKCNIAK